MTGSNRLLIGLGWPFVVAVCAWKTKKNGVVLGRRLETEVSILLAATLYAFLIPIKGCLSWVDSVILGALYLWYFLRILKGEVEPPDSGEGPAAKMILSWGPAARRVTALILFVIAGASIYMAAKPFAEGLLAAGHHFGIDQFILVQWLAPLASESPEFIVAALFAARGLASASFNTLLSSLLNQWTLLVGMLPLAFSLAGRNLRPMILDAQQRGEIFLTASFSLLAVVVLSDFRFTKKEAAVLFMLFAAQAFYPAVEGALGIDAMTVRYGFAYLYLAAAFLLFLAQSGKRTNLARLGKAFFQHPE
jgi:cation:H+ antiporter